MTTDAVAPVVTAERTAVPAATTERAVERTAVPAPTAVPAAAQAAAIPSTAAITAPAPVKVTAATTTATIAMPTTIPTTIRATTTTAVVVERKVPTASEKTAPAAVATTAAPKAVRAPTAVVPAAAVVEIKVPPATVTSAPAPVERKATVPVPAAVERKVSAGTAAVAPSDATKPSRTGSLLREFAQTVAVEERDLSNSTDLLIIAADQLAFERGLVSPLRRNSSTRGSPRATFFEEDSSNGEGSGRNKESHSDATRRMFLEEAGNVPKNDTDKSADALLSQMDITPNNMNNQKNVPGAGNVPQNSLPNLKDGNQVSLDDDIKNKNNKKDNHFGSRTAPQRPRSRSSREGDARNSTHDLAKSSNSRANERYNQRLSQTGRENAEDEDNEGNSRPNFQKQSQKLSAVARHLSKSEDLLSNNKNKSSPFLSATHEILFRTMHTNGKDNRQGENGKDGNGRKGDGKGENGRGKENLASGQSQAKQEYDGRPDEKDRKKDKITAIVDRLSTSTFFKPSIAEIKRDPTLRYTRYEDARECTFRPTINGGKDKKESKNSEDREEEEEQEKASANAFIERQEAQERTRRTELDAAIGKAGYDKLIDKKQCPVCGAKQSYDEVKEKRKECPNCHKEYKRTTTWGEIGNKFFKREKENALKSSIKKEEIKQKVLYGMNTIERRVIDETTGRIIVIKEYSDQNERISNAESEKEFHERMKKDVLKKENRLKALDATVHGVNCTFQPRIEHKRGPEDDEDDEEKENPVTAFMSRMESDLDDRKKNMPDRYISKEDVMQKMELSKSFEQFK